MALIKCPECGKENVSDNAEMCPECGYPIKEKETELKKKKILNVLAIVVPISVVLVLVAVLGGSNIKIYIQDQKALDDIIDLTGYTSSTTIYEVKDRYGDFTTGLGNLNGTIYSANFEKTFLGVDGSLGVSVNSNDDSIRYSSYDSFRWDIIDKNDSEVFMRRFIKLYGTHDSEEKSWDDSLVEIWLADETHPEIKIEVSFNGEDEDSGVSRVSMYIQE